MFSQPYPYSPITLAERLDLPPRSPATVDRCLSSTSNEADSKPKISIRNDTKSRETPYSRRIIPSQRSPDDAREIARNYKKGNYERPASFTSSRMCSSPASSALEASRTSSLVASSSTSTSSSTSSSTSPPLASKAPGSYNSKLSSDRTHNPHKEISFLSNVNSIPVNPRRREERRTRSLEESNDVDDDGEQVKKKQKIGLNADDSGFGVSLVERISPPSTKIDFPHWQTNAVEEGNAPCQSTTGVGEPPFDKTGTTVSDKLVESFPPRTHYVYEPRRPSSVDDSDTFEEGELIEEDEQSFNRGTKVLIGNLEPGTTADDVAVSFALSFLAVLSFPFSSSFFSNPGYITEGQLPSI